MFLEDKKKGKKYELTKELGRGAYGKCYLATDIKTGQEIACKQVSSRENFELEVSIHKKLNHKHVIQFISCFIKGNIGYITMELCPHGSISDLLKVRTVLTNPEVKCVMKQLVSAVEYLHNKLIVHGDVKKSNLLISADFEVKLADFGLAQQLESKHGFRESFCGTNNYIAPEIINGSGSSFPADIWAIGCVFYGLLAGKEPFSSTSIDGTLENIKAISYKRAKLTILAHNFVKTIFVLDPKERPTISKILLDKYFQRGPILDALPATIFQGPPKVLKKRAGKENRPPLADCTNKINFKRVNESKKSAPKFKVLPNEKSSLDYVLKPFAKQNEGFKIFEDLEDSKLDLLDTDNAGDELQKTVGKLLKRTEIMEITDMKQIRTSFVCISRWAEMKSDVLGYTLSDGSMGVNVGGKDEYFYRYPSGKMKYYSSENTITLVKDREPKELQEFIVYCDNVRKQLMALKRTGPVSQYQRAVVVQEWKIYNEGADKSSVAFLLSDGSCQINGANHEKFLINGKQDLLASWIDSQPVMLSLQHVLDTGLPYGFRDKLSFISHFLEDVRIKKALESMN